MGISRGSERWTADVRPRLLAPPLRDRRYHQPWCCWRRFSSPVLLFLVVSALPLLAGSDANGTEAIANDVRNWAWRFGTEISNQSLFASNFTEIKENFEEFKAKPHHKDIAQLTEKILRDLGNLVSSKTESLKVLIQEAEKNAKDHKYSTDIDFRYFNAKKLYRPNTVPKLSDDEDPDDWMPMEMHQDRRFDDADVNFTYSAIHVATNIYSKSAPVLNAVKWSEGMNSRFKNNRVVDPFIAWQFFCSSTGFIRLFPARKWPDDDPDMYECRTRPWYVQAAASAKDVVILLDGSGSMMGLRKEIARNVIVNILDTLTENDYVSILRFSNVIEPVVSCFHYNLVQANARNIREFKENLSKLETLNIANFTAALKQAFEMLQHYNKSRLGSQCNQAIMLVTDGAPYTYEEIFRHYNWPNIPVRVFTYLIGREVTDTREVNWMACANRGYYTHVTTLAEVREQVLKYVPVMSRPMVLSRRHPIVWTPVYGDMTEPKLTDWLWEEREKAQVRKLILQQRLFRKKDPEPSYYGDGDALVAGDDSSAEYLAADQADAPALRRRARSSSSQAEALRRPPKKKNPPLYTTVAAPVYNTSNDTAGTANLLGVVGIDVPLREFQKVAHPFKLGVNAYSFMINKNGHILFHPDHRPMYKDMLKPYYSNVDLLEVELLDNETADRLFNHVFAEIRKNMIDGRRGWMEFLPMRVHLDDMKRVVTRRHNYQYGAVPNSSFSFGIAVPQPYGSTEILGEVQVQSREEDWRKYFEGENWRVHPDWEYCVDIHSTYDTPETIIKDFLERVMKEPSETSERYKWKPDSKRQFYNTMVCDKELVQSLVFDAKVTSPEKIMARQPSKQLYSHVSKDTTFKSNGIVMTFVATRSGLLRFTDHRSEEEKNSNSERPFYELHTRAIDELFYRRAVDFHQISNTSFIYSVPFDAGARYAANDNSPIYVTGSRAVFLGTEKKAPAAVVGLQIKHSVFEEKFLNISSKCENQKPCLYTCGNEALDCFLLDNNGFVIVSSNRTQVGKFFGEIDDTLFLSMVKYNVYKRVRIYDYQAICKDKITPSGPANFRTSPFHALWNILAWAWKKLVVLVMHFEVYNVFSLEWIVTSSDYDYGDYAADDALPIPSKTRARPCDMEIELFEMQPMEPEPIKGKLSKCSDRSCDKQFIVQPVPSSNLVMLAVFTDCNCTSTPAPLAQREVVPDEAIFCNQSSLPRQRPDICINYHAEEAELKRQCGRASTSQTASLALLLAATLLAKSSSCFWV